MTKSINITDWPQADVDAWQTAVNDDPLAPGDGGRGASWREGTKHRNATAYGRWLAWLVANGHFDPQEEASSRATEKRVRAYNDAMIGEGLSDHGRANNLEGLSSSIRVMWPKADWRFISLAAARMRSIARPLKDPTARFRDPEEILALAHGKMVSAEKDIGANRVDRAVRFRDGLILSFWVLSVRRVANLAGVRFGIELVETERGYRLEYAAGVMKSGRPESFAWPSALQRPLERYLDHYRHVLAGRRSVPREGDALWLTHKGDPMKVASVAQMIHIQTEKAFGVAINSHTIRHITATMMAERHPEHIYDVPIIMGHARMETSEKHYNLARGRKAAETYQTWLLNRGRAGVR